MQIDRREIQSALKRKGFIQEDAGHHYFYHEHQGKRTGIKTFTSHGSSYKTYGNALLKSMARELKLDGVPQLASLLNCPMDAKQYTAILKAKGFLTESPPSTSAPKSRKQKGKRRRRRGA